ncbi:Gas vesicle synthesis protein GvpL/GvpF [Streptomyces sp. YIM 130001]|uniref:GvpL/GvpF family gas vesicle protein n=1 Tax=Streptomyces sp. YIM 130001 TaxID=2259644 RepID=UPI000E64B686|nr:GvpL/GvpF family gas vesicle protein [Streptomyces sp. YIM 130001]RII17919.1 Gas vesicle synthesis protein GvpL/GvpF [Streptomyces sp. YIM 130001]
MSHHGMYVYAIVPAGTSVPQDAVGVGKPPAVLHTLSAGRLAAVVSAAPAQLRARRRDLLAHQNLLMALVEAGPVLPMRFGTVAADEAALRAQLAAAEPEHLAALERLTGQVEINVKALPAQDSLAALLAGDATVRRLRDEARRRPGYEANVRLGESVATALSRRAAEAGRIAVHDLTSMARATAPGPDVQGCALNVSFLVPRADADRFRATAERFATTYQEHVELRVAGPLPCYSFVDTGAVRATPVAADKG